MNNRFNDDLTHQKENLDYKSLKNSLYSVYKLCLENILQQKNIIGINQIKLEEMIIIIKSSINNIITFQSQLQNYIIKLESDIRHFLKTEFQFNILKNSLESKIRAYMNIEEEYQELKSKVHFSNGKFLENDRKDHEILILKKENSTIKKEIIKYEKKIQELEERINKDQDVIDELNVKNNKLNNLVSDLKKHHFQNARSNSSINLNIINNNNINPNKNKKNGLFLKSKNTFFNTPKSPFNLESLHSTGSQSYNKTRFEYKRKKQNEFSIDDKIKYNYVTNYNKIFNLNKKSIYGTRKNKSRSISMLLDDTEKKENYFRMNNSINKFISNINGKSESKINNLPKYKLSFSNKNESLANLINMKDNLSKKIIKKKWNIKSGNNSIFIKRISHKNKE